MFSWWCRVLRCLDTNDKWQGLPTAQIIISNLATRMAYSTSEVPVQYSPGLPRVKNFVLWGFFAMTVGFFLALIPVSSWPNVFLKRVKRAKSLIQTFNFLISGIQTNPKTRILSRWWTWLQERWLICLWIYLWICISLSVRVIFKDLAFQWPI